MSFFDYKSTVTTFQQSPRDIHELTIVSIASYNKLNYIFQTPRELIEISLRGKFTTNLIKTNYAHSHKRLIQGAAFFQRIGLGPETKRHIIE